MSERKPVGADRMIGRVLGEFTLRERLGQGGYGVVYRARQLALDREAVVKVLQTKLADEPAAVERFLREARLASRLDHPYAAHIYAFGAEPDGELWIAMEYVRGTPLDELISREGPLAVRDLVPLMDCVCEVVHTAHEQGIVHRDIKPANVMVLKRAGRLLPKLLDLGIAKSFADTDIDGATTILDGAADLLEDDTVAEPGVDIAKTVTRVGALVGSPAYMAPEQWTDPRAVDARTDLYALGVVAFESLTGKPPFTGKTLTAIAAAHATEPPPPLGAGFPPGLDAVIAKALAKAPADRYADALAFATALREAAAIADAPTPSNPQATPVPAPPRRRGLALAGAAIFVLGAGAAGFVLATREQATPAAADATLPDAARAADAAPVEVDAAIVVDATPMAELVDAAPADAHRRRKRPRDAGAPEPASEEPAEPGVDAAPVVPAIPPVDADVEAPDA